jgi:zinc transporter ZupT
VGTVGLVSVLAGLANVVGGWFTLVPRLTREQLEELTALGGGFLLGSALFSMVPHALAGGPDGPLYVALGYFGLFLVRRLAASGRKDRAGDRRASAESAWAATLGMALHSFLDGGALGVTARAGGGLAAVAFLAVFLHKVPEGFSLSALVMAGTGSRRSALLATVVTGLATVAGALLAYTWAAAVHLPQGALFGLAAGTFLYVGSTDVLPHLGRRPLTTWAVLAGAAIVYLLARTSLPHTH